MAQSPAQRVYSTNAVIFNHAVNVPFKSGHAIRNASWCGNTSNAFSKLLLRKRCHYSSANLCLHKKTSTKNNTIDESKSFSKIYFNHKEDFASDVQSIYYSFLHKTNILKCQWAMLLIYINNCAAERKQLRLFNRIQLTDCLHKLTMRTSIIQSDTARLHTHQFLW